MGIVDFIQERDEKFKEISVKNINFNYFMIDGRFLEEQIGFRDFRGLKDAMEN